MYKWVNFDLLNRKKDLYKEKKIKFSSMFLNAWSWSIVNRHDMVQGKNAIVNEIMLNITEENITSEIKRRKRKQKTTLLVKRIIGFIMNVLFLMAGWVGIVAVNYYTDAIENYFINTPIINKVVQFIPGLCLTFINFLI